MSFKGLNHLSNGIHYQASPLPKIDFKYSTFSSSVISLAGLSSTPKKSGLLRKLSTSFHKDLMSKQIGLPSASFAVSSGLFPFSYMNHSTHSAPSCP